MFCFAEFMELYETMRTGSCINNVHEVCALPNVYTDTHTDGLENINGNCLMLLN